MKARAMRQVQTMTKVAALLMAAGNSRRMGGPNKLLMPFSGKPLLSYGVDAIDAANFVERILVTGRDHQEIQKLAPDFSVVHNPLFQQGFGTSLAAGFSELIKIDDIDGGLVMLADMPLITGTQLNQLIDAFDGTSIGRAAHQGAPGNPVILPRVLFANLAELDGEQSGQAIIKASGLPVRLVELGLAAIADIDTPEALAALQEAVL